MQCFGLFLCIIIVSFISSLSLVDSFWAAGALRFVCAPALGGTARLRRTDRRKRAAVNGRKRVVGPNAVRAVEGCDSSEGGLNIGK